VRLPAVLIAVSAVALLTAWASPVPAAEDDFLVTDGPLSDEDFYRLVACRALPGQDCSIAPIRWPPNRAHDLAVDFAETPPGFPVEAARRAQQAVDDAIRQINDTGAALHLRRARPDERPDVMIHLANVREGDVIEATGVRGVDGQTIGAALVTVWWSDRNELSKAVIVLALDLPPADVGPVVLEELTQSMGLMTDIRNPYYEELSVFSEDSNRVTRLGPQDIAALRRHYPPEDPL
jgi:hypothetical protein